MQLLFYASDIDKLKAAVARRSRRALPLITALAVYLTRQLIILINWRVRFEKKSGVNGYWILNGNASGVTGVINSRA